MDIKKFLKCDFNILSKDILPNPIPERLRDESLSCTKNNTSLLFIFCIIIRIVLGILVFYNIIPSIFIYLLSAFIIVAFSFKSYYNKKTWKNYLRTIISYILVIIFTILNNYSSNKHNFNIGGIIIILDVLLGQQSRFITSNFES
jgi:hypothetical protein